MTPAPALSSFGRAQWAKLSDERAASTGPDIQRRPRYNVVFRLEEEKTFMRKLTMTLTVVTLALGTMAVAANAQTQSLIAGSLRAQAQNFTPITKAACNGTWGRYGCGPGTVRYCRGGRCWCGPC
jgi:hypothetical protein